MNKDNRGPFFIFGQAGWKTVTEKGYSFKHPADWEYIDLGGDGRTAAAPSSAFATSGPNVLNMPR